MKPLTEVKAWRILRDMFESNDSRMWGYSGPYICNILDCKEAIVEDFPKELRNMMSARIHQHILATKEITGEWSPVLELIDMPWEDSMKKEIRAMFCELMALECISEQRAAYRLRKKLSVPARTHDSMMFLANADGSF